MLKDCLGKYAMQDTNLNVRRVAWVTFNSAAHNKQSSTNLLIRYLLKYLQQSRTTLTNVQVLNLIQGFCKGEMFSNKKWFKHNSCSFNK
jgi:hypothetical protein